MQVFEVEHEGGQRAQHCREHLHRRRGVQNLAPFKPTELPTGPARERTHLCQGPAQLKERNGRVQDHGGTGHTPEHRLCGMRLANAWFTPQANCHRHAPGDDGAQLTRHVLNQQLPHAGGRSGKEDPVGMTEL